jgi:hypothetical protein
MAARRTVNKETYTMTRYYNIYIWRGVEPQLRGPYGGPEERLAAALRTWDDDTANREDDGIFKLTSDSNGEPEVYPGSTENGKEGTDERTKI